MIFLNSFDQLLQSAEKQNVKGDEWTVFITEMQAQFFYHAGTLLLKKAQVSLGMLSVLMSSSGWGSHDAVVLVDARAVWTGGRKDIWKHHTRQWGNDCPYLSLTNRPATVGESPATLPVHATWPLSASDHPTSRQLGTWKQQRRIRRSTVSGIRRLVSESARLVSSMSTNAGHEVDPVRDDCQQLRQLHTVQQKGAWCIICEDLLFNWLPTDTFVGQ